MWNRGNGLLMAGLFLFNIALNYVIFLPGEFPYRDSIEAGYAGMARFLSRHPNPWGWQPLQYCGLPVHNMYQPAVVYTAAALIRMLPGVPPEYVYRLLVTVITCLLPASVFLFVFYFRRSRLWAGVSALGVILCSPLYRMVDQINHDRGVADVPWRIQVLIKYGEGPHSVGLTLLPLALIALWAAATGRKYWQILTAALLLAAVSLSNWVAGLALAGCAAMLLLSGLGAGKSSGFRAWPMLAAAALAYLLACFWLTPDYIGRTFFNWPVDSFGYKLRIQQYWLLAGLAGGVLLIRLVLLFFRRHSYLCFLLLSVFGFGFVVLTFYRFGVDTIPESRRYAIELELFLIILFFELLRRVIEHPGRLLKAAALLICVFVLPPDIRQTFLHLTGDHSKLYPVPKEHTIEYQTSRRLAELKPAGRVFVSGGTRFRLNSWFDLPQTGGTFETGLRNRMPVHWMYNIRTGIGSRPEQEGRDAALQLKTMGVEYIAVHGPKSREHYRDLKNHRKLEGVLERVHSEGEDTIYRVPFLSLAHLVRIEEVAEHWRVDELAKFVAAMEDPGRPRLRVQWNNPSELTITGPVPERMFVSVLVSYDPGWQAYQDGGLIRAQADHNGFLFLHSRPAESSTILLRFGSTRQQRTAAALSALAWVAALAGLFVRRSRFARRSSDPG